MANTYLTRTFGTTGNQNKIYNFSAWFKRKHYSVQRIATNLITSSEITTSNMEVIYCTLIYK